MQEQYHAEVGAPVSAAGGLAATAPTTTPTSTPEAEYYNYYTSESWSTWPSYEELLTEVLWAKGKSKEKGK